MKSLPVTLIIFLLMVLVACDSGQTAPTMNNLSIDLAVEPDPPTAGETTLVITVNDAEGNPIEDATVAVHGDMDHEGMTPIDREQSNGDGGIYRVPFEWTMGGGWILDVTVTLPDNKGIANQRFELFVGAISQDSIINQGATDTAGMDHATMNNMDADIQIQYIPDADPAIAGDASVRVILTSADGQPINDAHIMLHADMPAHDMMPVTAESREGHNGQYTIPLRWTMAGEWQVDLTVTLANTQTQTRTITQQVVMPDDSSDPNHAGT